MNYPTSKHDKSSVLRLQALLTAILLTAASTQVSAQGTPKTDSPENTPETPKVKAPDTAPDAPSAKIPVNTSDTEIVQLSPFQVQANNYVGYMTNESLLGSRIRTALIDSPSAIQVLTPEFMQDVGAKSLYEALDYMTSVEQDESSIRFYNSRYAMAVRIRGIKAFNSVTQDFFNIYWTPDIYNTSDMGLARGANSILFGVGNPAGVFTATSKAAVFGQNIYDIEGKRDSYGTRRVSTDINQEIIKNRLALRFCALDENQQYFYTPTYNKLKAEYGALTAVLIDHGDFKTTLSGNYERRNADRDFGQQWTPDDDVTAWIRAGRPLLSGPTPGLGQTNATLLPLGLTLDSTSGSVGRTFVNISSTGIVSAFVQKYNVTPIRNDLSPPSLLNPTNPGDRTFSNQAASPVAFDVNLSGPGADNPYHAWRYALMLDQQIGPNFFSQLAYSKNDFFLKWGDPAVGLQIYADVNANLPDGTVNPNAGKLYTISPQRPEWNHWSYEELRYTGTYDLKLGKILDNKWFGDHQISLLANHSKEDFWHNVFEEQNSTPLPGASADIADASNSISRRTYLDNNSQFLAGPSMLNPLYGGGVKSVFIARALPDSSLADLKSIVETLQSKFWDDRIVITLGFRQDHLLRYTGNTAGQVRDPITRDFIRAENLPFNSTPLLDRKLHSMSKGVVLHVTSWAALTWNKSENFNPTATTQDIYGHNLAPEGGQAKDYGIRFSLPNNRLYATFNVFENSDVNINSFNANRPTDAPALRGLLILAGMDPNSITSSNSIGDTSDLAAKGKEVEITANLTSNWRLTLSYTHETAITTNEIPITAAWWASHVGAFMALDQNAFLPASTGLGTETVGQAINGPLGWAPVNINPNIAQNGRAPAAFRDDNLAVITNYTFTDGALKGFSVGGKYRYYGKSLYPPPGNGYYLNGATDPGFGILGVNFGYETRLSKGWYGPRGVGLGIFLVVDNALNYTRVIRSESANIYRQLPSRSASLDVTLKF